MQCAPSTDVTHTCTRPRARMRAHICNFTSWYVRVCFLTCYVCVRLRSRACNQCPIEPLFLFVSFALSFSPYASLYFSDVPSCIPEYFWAALNDMLWVVPPPPGMVVDSRWGAFVFSIDRFETQQQLEPQPHVQAWQVQQQYGKHNFTYDFKGFEPPWLSVHTVAMVLISQTIKTYDFYGFKASMQTFCTRDFNGFWISKRSGHTISMVFECQALKTYDFQCSRASKCQWRRSLPTGGEPNPGTCGMKMATMWAWYVGSGFLECGLSCIPIYFHWLLLRCTSGACPPL